MWNSLSREGGCGIVCRVEQSVWKGGCGIVCLREVSVELSARGRWVWNSLSGEGGCGIVCRGKVGV